MCKIDNNLEKYICDHTSPEDPVLTELTRKTNLSTYNPRMISGIQQGKFLEMLCRMLQPRRVLEIGTFTGYSAICMAKGIMPNGHIDTIEQNDELAEMITDFLGRAGVANHVTLLTGNALEVIPTLNERYDLVYIDGEKLEYCKYYEAAFPKLAPYGYMLADNVLWNGKVYDNLCNDPQTVAMRKFNELVQADGRVENVLMPMRDGLMLIQKIHE